MGLSEAIRTAQQLGLDLIEVAAEATPPVCRLDDYHKYLYVESKRTKHQRGKKPKEVQLSPVIEPHDYGVKLAHAVDFLCDDTQVKVSLRLKRRQKAHPELAFQVVDRFIKDLSVYARPDATPKLTGNSINFMLSPLPREKRAPNPHRPKAEPEPSTDHSA
jgi:translation initiation factor IF-3